MDKLTPVSVIIPVYNGERYLESMISCLSGQTLGGFEVIIVNDGSTDGTEQLLERICSRVHPFELRVINKENGGVSSARNRGIREASRQRLCFCDVDDILSPVYIEHLLKAMEATGCDMVLGLVSSETEELLSAGDSFKGAEICGKTELLRRFLYNGGSIHHCCALYDRSLLSEDMQYREGYRYSEDVHLLWRLLASNEHTAVVEEPLYCYLRNEGSAMNRKMTADRMDAIILMRELETFMTEHAPEFSEEFIKYAVARHHWSILWQAAGCFDKYEDFKNYAEIFDMKTELKKLYGYPSVRESLSSRLYCKFPRIYYRLMRIYLLFR